MKKQITFFVFTLFFLMGVQSVSAQAKVGKKQIRQQQRITQGLVTGALTVPEYARLQRQQVRIQKKKQVFKSDGVLTGRERAVLLRDQKRASRHIYRQKNDLANRPF